MANYPAYDILLTSTQGPESGIEDDFSQGGQQHSRIFHSQQYYRFTLEHQLTLAQWQSLMTTYLAGKRDTYTLTYLTESPIVTYSVKFTAPPAIGEHIDGTRFFVTCRLRGTKD